MIKPAKCDARAGVSNIKKKGGFQTIFADSSKGFKRESFETFRQLEHWNLVRSRFGQTCVEFENTSDMKIIYFVTS